MNGDSHDASVAVVIPCFNDGETLVEAVRSVQGEPRLGELVVVDDGSTDGATLEVFAALEAEGVRILHRENGGLGAARMSGVRATTAEYVLALDADDRLQRGALQSLAEALDADASVSVVWGDYELFGDRSYRQRTASTLDAWQITYQNDLPATMMCRREALLEAGGWVGSHGYEDWNLWMALAERSAKGRHLDKVVYCYRQHGVRMLGESAKRHADTHALLRAAHPALFARRSETWRASRAPVALRVLLPLIFRLPIGPDRRRLLGGAACHLANGRGVALLARRVMGR